MNTKEKSMFYIGWLMVILAIAGRILQYLETDQSFPYLFGFALVITAQQQYIKRLEGRDIVPAPQSPGT